MVFPSILVILSIAIPAFAEQLHMEGGRSESARAVSGDVSRFVEENDLKKIPSRGIFNLETMRMSDQENTQSTISIGTIQEQPAIQIVGREFKSTLQIVRLHKSATDLESAKQMCKDLAPEGTWKVPDLDTMSAVLEKYRTVEDHKGLLPSIRISTLDTEVLGHYAFLKQYKSKIEGFVLWTEDSKKGPVLIYYSHYDKGKPGRIGYPARFNRNKNWTHSDFVKLVESLREGVLEKSKKEYEAALAELEKGIPVICVRITTK